MRFTNALIQTIQSPVTYSLVGVNAYHVYLYALSKFQHGNEFLDQARTKKKAYMEYQLQQMNITVREKFLNTSTTSLYMAQSTLRGNDSSTVIKCNCLTAKVRSRAFILV